MSNGDPERAVRRLLALEEDLAEKPHEVERVDYVRLLRECDFERADRGTMEVWFNRDTVRAYYFNLRYNSIPQFVARKILRELREDLQAAGHL